MNAVNNLAVHENRREFRRLFIGCRNGRRRPRNTVNLTTPLAGLEQAAGHQGQRINMIIGLVLFSVHVTGFELNRV